MPQPRTAVVIVHGIGEQRPLETLRGFVGGGPKDGEPQNGLLISDEGERPFINADVLTGLTYSRRISYDGAHKLNPLLNVDDVERRSYSRITHFYEYYWAYRFRSTVWRHLLPVVFRLLRSDRAGLADGAVKGGIRPVENIWRAAALLCCVAVSALVVFTVTATLQRPQVPWPWLLLTFLAASAAILFAERAGVLSTARVAIAIPLVSIAGAFCGYLIDGLNTSDLWQPVSGQFGWISLFALVWLILSGAALWVYARRRNWGIVLIGIGVVGLAVVVYKLPAPAVDFLQSAQAVLAVIVALLPALAGGFALRSFGDAARYLSNSPDDLNEREEIRAGLVDMIHRLHIERDPVTGRFLYDRIVIVGHSLGGVIAYDAIGAAWARANSTIYLPDRDATEEIYPIEGILKALEQANLPVAPHTRRPTTAETRDDARATLTSPESWRRSQRRLQAALRTEVRWAADRLWRPPSRWIVSDFISLGSPLAHADILFADGADDLKQLCKDRLLATCPPAPQQTSPAREEHPFRFRSWRGQHYCTKLHHAAVFAATTWTNIYFTHDLVGGPLRDRLGQGIDDWPLSGRSPGLGSFLFSFPHTSYWKAGKRRRNRSGTKTSVAKLRDIILREYPTIIASGSISSVKSFRKALMKYDLVGEAPQPMHPQVELRVLRISTKEPVRAWTWIGTDPWYPAATAARLVRLAHECGLEVVISDGSPPTPLQPETAESAAEPSDEAGELRERTRERPTPDMAEPDEE